MCTALIGFAAAQAHPDVAAEACGLERVLAEADETLAVKLVEASNPCALVGEHE